MIDIAIGDAVNIINSHIAAGKSGFVEKIYYNDLGYPINYQVKTDPLADFCWDVFPCNIEKGNPCPHYMPKCKRNVTNRNSNPKAVSI